MGARHSKRSVDISAAAKKDKESTSEEKLERIDEPEAAKQNGTTTPRPEEPKVSCYVFNYLVFNN